MITGEGLVALGATGEAEKKEQQQGEGPKRGRGRREESVGLERDMAVLRNIVECAGDQLLDLDTVSLWEGVTCISSTQLWKCVQHVCYKLYEVGVA